MKENKVVKFSFSFTNGEPPRYNNWPSIFLAHQGIFSAKVLGYLDNSRHVMLQISHDENIDLCKWNLNRVLSPFGISGVKITGCQTISPAKLIPVMLSRVAQGYLLDCFGCTIEDIDDATISAICDNLYDCLMGLQSVDYQCDIEIANFILAHPHLLPDSVSKDSIERIKSIELKSMELYYTKGLTDE